MDHNQAIQEGFAEKYLLSDLTPAQRDQFEEHFFDCPICSADVQSGAVFIDNARAVLRADETFAPAQSTFSKFGLPFQSAALLSVCLLVVLGYQNIVTIPHGQSRASSGVPRVTQRVSLLGMGSRAEAKARVIRGNEDNELEIEIPGSSKFTSYELKILNAKNQISNIVPISSEQVKNVVLLSIPANFLLPGDYHVVPFGKDSNGSEQELTRLPISVK